MSSQSIIAKRQQHRESFMGKLRDSSEHKVTDFTAQADRWWPGTVQTKIEKEAVNETSRDN